MFIRIWMCAIALLWSSQLCGAQQDDDAQVRLLMEIMKGNANTHGELRARFIDSLQGFKKTTSSKELLFTSDYFISFAIWRRESIERVYNPYEKFKTRVMKMQEEYPDFAADPRMLSLKIKLHDIHYKNDPATEKAWLVKFIATEVPWGDVYGEAGDVFRNGITESNLTEEAVLLLADYEAANAQQSGKTVDDAYSSLLKILDLSSSRKKAAEIARADKAIIVEHMKAGTIPQEADDTDPIEKDALTAAAGKLETLSSAERTKEMNQKIDLRNLSAKKEMLNYLLWLCGDGLRLTTFSEMASEEDFTMLVYGKFQALLIGNSQDPKAFWRIARMVAKAGATDRLISLFEAGARRAAERNAEAPKK